MKPLVRTALLGTRRAPQLPAVPGPIAVAAHLQPLERRFRAVAGAWTVWTTAGRVLPTPPPAPPPCPQETLPACSPVVARFVRDALVGRYRELLPDVLLRLAQAGQRLPHRVLPRALDARDLELRALLAPVLGARGAWLAGIEPAWSWANPSPPADPLALIEALETAGEDARPGLVAALRAVDPVGAVQAVRATWDEGRAQTRLATLEALLPELSSADEAFLRQAIDDRAERVREAAAALLAHLPDSPWTVALGVEARGLVAEVDGALQLVTPEGWSPDLRALGLRAKVPASLGERAWWSIQLVGRVDPVAWEAGLGAPPAELVARIAPDGHDLAEALSRAALSHARVAWLGPLWAWWQRAPAHPARRAVHHEIALALLRALPDADRVDRVLRAAAPVALLDTLACPWSRALGAWWLKRVLDAASTGDLAELGALVESMPLAARALPLGLAAVLPAHLPIPDAGSWRFRGVHRAWDRLISTVTVRTRLAAELHASTAPDRPGAP